MFMVLGADERWTEDNIIDLEKGLGRGFVIF